MPKIISKKNIPVIIFTIFILTGILIMFYPVITNYINSTKSSQVIKSYATNVSSQNEDYKKSMLNKAREYNSKLSGRTIVDVFSNTADTEQQGYSDILNISGDGIMGYIEIPKIDVKTPIYHGTSAKVLQKGVGHLKDSSFPIGGESTHTILAGHRGLPTSRLFTDLDQIKVGDLFYIYILGETLAYQVDQIIIVEPSEVEPLRLQEGKDYVTLVTCTPYAINTHRLLVRGTRVEYKKEELKTIPVERKMSTSDIVFYISLFVVFIAIIIVIVVSRKLKKQQITTINNSSKNNQDVLETINKEIEEVIDNNQINETVIEDEQLFTNHYPEDNYYQTYSNIENSEENEVDDDEDVEII